MQVEPPVFATELYTQVMLVERPLGNSSNVASFNASSFERVLHYAHEKYMINCTCGWDIWLDHHYALTQSLRTAGLPPGSFNATDTRLARWPAICALRVACRMDRMTLTTLSH